MKAGAFPIPDRMKPSRLYASARLDGETYARVKAAGFKWAPKQGLFFAPAWSPSREDLLLDLAGEIADEDTSLIDRAEERAERFDGYSERRMADANAARKAVHEIADNIPFGQPILVGHHSERHARRDAERIENGMRKAVKLWRTSQYWERRAEGAIRAAKYKERPDVRARRIKTIEADKRKQERIRDEKATLLKLWTNLEKIGDNRRYEVAVEIANRIDHGYMRINGDLHSVWSVLKDGLLSLDEVRARRLKVLPAVIEDCDRWIRHCENRLVYERAMLDAAGGTVADKTGPVVGGAVRCWASPRGGWSYIRKVNKVTVTIEDNWGNGGRNFRRTIPFDKLAGVMTKAEVDEARAAGQVLETSDGTGFILNKTGVGMKIVPMPPAGSAPADDGFSAMEQSLRAGVQTATVNQLFATPSKVAEHVVLLACIEPGHSVLEPSAGTGALLRAIKAEHPEAVVTCIEQDARLAEAIGADCADFLAVSPTGTFDRVVMNPPFERGADIEHIKHAIGFLKPGGRLVAICANGPRQQRELKPLATEWRDLPAGSFKSEGTNVNAAIVVIDR